MAGIEDKESSNEKKEYANEKKIENIFRKIEEWMPDDSRLDYERCLIRGYAVEESEEHAKAILRIGKKILDEKPEERLVKECTSYMASAAETARDWDMALEMYTDMLEWEEESKKEDIYQKLVKIQGEKGLKDQALEICRKGAEELKDSKQLRILYMRMQCSGFRYFQRNLCTDSKRVFEQMPMNEMKKQNFKNWRRNTE